MTPLSAHGIDLRTESWENRGCASLLNEEQHCFCRGMSAEVFKTMCVNVSCLQSWSYTQANYTFSFESKWRATASINVETDAIASFAESLSRIFKPNSFSRATTI